MRKITSVVERCNTIATFRRISIWLMETTARWTPITAEMEVKVTLGRHIWEYAQMADALGKRTFELRQPEIEEPLGIALRKLRRGKTQYARVLLHKFGKMSLKAR